MTNIWEIKPLIRNFIVNNLDSKFGENVYWIGERQEIPKAPYCVLSVISENKDKRTSTHEDDKTITTIYKIATITVCIYNSAIGDGYDVEKEFAYKEINKLEGIFETKNAHQYFYGLDCSIQSISSIRPLHEETDGGYIYRYEFDLTIGFNETISTNYENSESVIINIQDETNVDTEIG